VRRRSVANPDSGAESPVYGAAPSARAGREDPAARRPRGGAPCYAAGAPGPAATRSVPPGGAARGIMVTGDRILSGLVAAGSPRLVATCAMSVVDRHSGRWYVKDIRASTQPMGTQ
jgi:hypothetical protein